MQSTEKSLASWSLAFKKLLDSFLIYYCALLATAFAVIFTVKIATAAPGIDTVAWWTALLTALIVPALALARTK